MYKYMYMLSPSVIPCTPLLALTRHFIVAIPRPSSLLQLSLPRLFILGGLVIFIFLLSFGPFILMVCTIVYRSPWKSLFSWAPDSMHTLIPHNSRDNWDKLLADCFHWNEVSATPTGHPTSGPCIILVIRPCLYCVSIQWQRHHFQSYHPPAPSPPSFSCSSEDWFSWSCC